MSNNPNFLDFLRLFVSVTNNKHGKMAIKERIKTVLRHYNCSINKLANGKTATQRRLQRQINETSKVTDDTTNLILKSFPEVSPEWLLMGKGEMLTSDLLRSDMRPRIPVNASAGFLSGIATGVSLSDCELMPIIPGVPEYTCTIVVHGDSMEPKYESGDELAIVPVRNRNSLQWGQVYVLDTIDGVLIKRIYDHKESIRCVSFNPEYPDSFVEKSDINSIWRVVALLRRF